MTRKEEILNYANSFKGKGAESEELKEVIRLAIIDGATWADAHPKWKPSDEQMKALRFVIENTNASVLNPKLLQTLVNLENNLKAL